MSIYNEDRLIRFVNLKGGYDEISDIVRISDADPLPILEPVLADVTNGTDGTYYYYVDMDLFRKSSFQLELNGGSGTVTVTVEASDQNDGTAIGSCTYQDVTNSLFGAASYTADNFLIDGDGKTGTIKYLRLKVVASTGGANDGDWTIYARQVT